MSDAAQDDPARLRLDQLGYAGLPAACREEVLVQLEALTADGRAPHDEEIEALADESFARLSPRLVLESLEARSGTAHHAEAHAVLRVDGATVEAEGRGNGAVHAAFDAIRQAYPHGAVLREFAVAAALPGADAPAIATLRLEEHGRLVQGRGEDQDTVTAAANALVDALNRLAAKAERPTPVSEAFLTA